VLFVCFTTSNKTLFEENYIVTFFYET